MPLQHAKMLIILIFALIGWSMKILPQPIISLLIIVLIPLFGVGTFSESLKGFGQPFVWLLVSAFVFAAAMEKTGIGKRVAYTLLLYAKGKPNRTISYLFLSLITLGFFIPTSAGRTATILPIGIGIIETIEDKNKSINFAKHIMLGITFISSFICWALLTGSNSSIYAVAAIENTIGYEWSYLYWFFCNFPIMIIIVFCFSVILKNLFPLDVNIIPNGTSFIKNELEVIGKMKNSEKRILLLGIVTIFGWVTEPIHGVSIPLVALIVSILTCIPKIGVHTWSEVSPRISWDTVILFAAGFAMADAFQRNQTAAWLATKITDLFPTMSPLESALYIMLFVLFLRLGFAEMLAITATILPITINLAIIWGINPLWLIQITIIACSFGYFFPFQTTSNLITYNYRYYSEKDLINTGLLITPIVIFIVIICALFYWPLIGLSP